MPYIGFVDIIGTRASASISNQEYTNVICDFHNTLKQLSSLYGSSIYSYSDNAYIEVEKLDDLIKFFRLLRKSLMKKHRYFSATVDCGSLQSSPLHLNRNKGILMMFTSPKVIDLYLNQCQFSGIGISLSKDIVEELDHAGMKDAYCSSVFQKNSSDGVEGNLGRVHISASTTRAK